MVILLWITLYIPWEIAHPEDAIPGFDFAVFMCFLFDFFLSFRTTFYNNEQDEIVDSKLMFLNYLKSPFFFLDLISTIPFDGF